MLFKEAHYYLICILCLIVACSKPVEQKAQVEQAELGDTVIKIEKPVSDPFKTKKIKLLVSNNLNTFFVHKGENKGLEYELLSLFLKSKNMRLEIIQVEDTEHIREELHNLAAHMASSTFIIPSNKMKNVMYSEPIYTSDLLLVKHSSNKNSVNKPVVIKNAPYVRHLLYSEILPKDIELSYYAGITSKETLLKKVHSKEIESTIVDAKEYAYIHSFYSDVVVDRILETNAPVGIMFHPSMELLLKEFNEWVLKNRNSSDYAWIIKKYDALPSQLKNEMTLSKVERGEQRLSVYDPSIKKNSDKIDWDWRLIASIIRQESKFNPRVVSWSGAMGLMQLMPKTAKAHANLSKRQLLNPNLNIKAGAAYLAWIEKNYFNDDRISVEEKRKFVIASYNVGAGHIQDAQALCLKYKLNPYVWSGNVEKMLLAKSDPEYYKDPLCKYGYCRGLETSNYVNNILFYYKNYKLFYKA